MTVGPSWLHSGRRAFRAPLGFAEPASHGGLRRFGDPLLGLRPLGLAETGFAWWASPAQCDVEANAALSFEGFDLCRRRCVTQRTTFFLIGWHERIAKKLLHLVELGPEQRSMVRVRPRGIARPAIPVLTNAQPCPALAQNRRHSHLQAGATVQATLPVSGSAFLVIQQQRRVRSCWSSLPSCPLTRLDARWALVQCARPAAPDPIRGGSGAR